MKDLQERQANMSRINSKLMKVFEKHSSDNAASKSKRIVNVDSETKSLNSSILAKMDNIMNNGQNQILKVQKQLEESGRKVQ